MVQSFLHSPFSLFDNRSFGMLVGCGVVKKFDRKALQMFIRSSFWLITDFSNSLRRFIRGSGGTVFVGLYLFAISVLIVDERNKDCGDSFWLSLIGIRDLKSAACCSKVQVVKIILRGVFPACGPVLGEALTFAPS